MRSGRKSRPATLGLVRFARSPYSPSGLALFFHHNRFLPLPLHHRDHNVVVSCVYVRPPPTRSPPALGHVFIFARSHSFIASRSHRLESLSSSRRHRRCGSVAVGYHSISTLITRLRPPRAATASKRRSADRMQLRAMQCGMRSCKSEGRNGAREFSTACGIRAAAAAWPGSFPTPLFSCSKSS